MKDKRYHLCFDSVDRGIMINGLYETRNRLIADGEDSDLVDNLLLKVIDAPTKRIRILCEEAHYGTVNV